jgi:hypothetical protein
MLLLLSMLAPGAAPPARVVPLRHAHAHNDYLHRRPLLDALEAGFCSVEADVFLVRGKLLVAHTWLGLRPGRTLEKLYLDPLRKRVRANKGRVYRGGPPFYLLIEIKTDARATYAALDRVLARYADILTAVKAGRCRRKAVTVVITGNCPAERIRAQKVRYAGIDGHPGDLGRADAVHLMPWISARWRSYFKWDGQGAMPKREKERLRALVRKAHRRGRLVRFWATPERPALWRELRTAGVDLINTDRLDDLRRFLRGEEKGVSAGRSRSAPARARW